MPAFFDTGFSVREPMWHGQGSVLDDYPTDWNDARKKAGLEWEPLAVPGYAKHTWMRGVELPEGSFVITEHASVSVDTGKEDGECIEIMVPLPNHKLVVRDDTNDTLGVVGKNYELITHAEMGEIIEAVIGVGAKFETAGSIKNGAQVWALVYLDEPFTVAGDDSPTYPFLALQNCHDGTGACKLVYTDVRIVCWNTYQMVALQGDKTGNQFTFRHTGSVHERIEEAKLALAGLRDESVKWQAMAEDLYAMPVTDMVFDEFLGIFLPEPSTANHSERTRNNWKKDSDTFRKLYTEAITTEAHRGTALGVVDAVVEWHDHLRRFQNRDTYLTRTMLKPNTEKALAVKTIRELCNA